MDLTSKLSQAIKATLTLQSNTEPSEYQNTMIDFIAEHFIEYEESSTLIGLMLQGSPSYPSNKEYLRRALIIGTEYSRALLRGQGEEDEEI